MNDQGSVAAGAEAGWCRRWGPRVVQSLWMLIPAVAAVCWWIGQIRGHDRLWALPGASLSQLRHVTEPDPDWAEVTGRDDIFAILVFLTLLGGALIGWLRRQGTRSTLMTAAHTGLTVLSIAGYLVSDLWENDLLGAVVAHLVDDPQDVTSADALLLARVSGAKWGFLAVAALLVAALWHRPPPAIDRGKVTWTTPDHASTSVRPPDPKPCAITAWRPDPTRLGISISGGGIRSASFAVGVLQELRHQGVLARARYVTSVSGGSYAAMALTSVNQDSTPASVNQNSTPEGAPPPTLDPPAFAPGSPEEQKLRRSLRYLASDSRVMAGALARIGLGLLINLLLIYLITFAVVRPLGWLIGTPLVQRGLRVEQPVVVEVLGEDDDPDRAAQPNQRCKLDGASSSSDEELERAIGPAYVIPGDPATTARQVSIATTQQCIHIRLPDGEEIYVGTKLTSARPGIVRIVDGTPTIAQQPEANIGFVSCRTADDPSELCLREVEPSEDELQKMLTVVQPALGIRAGSGGVVDADDLASAITVEDATLEPVSVMDRRQPLDVDHRHWVPFLAGLVLTIAFALRRVVGRPDRWRGWLTATSVIGGFTTVYGLVMLVLPWLADALPRTVNQLSETGPSPEALEQAPWILPGLPALLAWPLLAASAIYQFFSGRKKTTTPPPKRARNATAFLRKVVAAIRRFLVGTILVVLAVVNALNILVVGAMNGPGQQLPWLSRELLGYDLIRHFPPDLVMWVVITGLLALTYGVGESTSWSPAPVYKRRLAWAFAWGRDADDAKRRDYGPSPSGDWAALAPNRPEGADASFEERTGKSDPRDRTGYLDGHHGDGTELVLCCAANVLGGDRGAHGSGGEDRAPTGRGAVSFSASRSYLGGPEVGWMETPDYIARLGRRRKWDINIPGFTALSGAAVSPAMGKKELGPIGSVLAVLNVRLGAWLPHPRWVKAMTTDTAAPLPARQWEHNPSWPWFTREVTRRYRGDAPYLYVTDGGHWENLGLVEALRRGCTTVVAISSAGDGELSHATLAEAVEIARSDLGVEIELSEVWKARPPVGATPSERLPSGRQYILDPSGEAVIGSAAPQGFAYGTLRFSRPDGAVVKGEILLIEATMVDGLPVDVHAYAESHPEFPNVSTGDQFLTNRDFESYRVLGREITRAALGGVPGALFRDRVEGCDRRETSPASSSSSDVADHQLVPS